MFSLLLSLSRPSVEVVAIIADPTIAAHQYTAETIASGISARPVLLSPGQRWELSVRPRVVVAIGDAAERDAAQRWPHPARASVLQWQLPATPPKSHLHVPARLDPACSVEQLRERTGTTWIVMASPADEDAKLIANALDASLWQGDPAQLQRRLKTQPPTSPTSLLVRSDPTLAVAAWLAYLGYMDHLPAVAVGSDSPGFRRFGVQNWVAPDLDALAHNTISWVDRQLRSRRRQHLTLPLPCKAGTP